MKNNLYITVFLISTIYSLDIFGQSLQQEDTYKKLITEIRCMVCQNQNISESEAPLAIDLRKKVKEMINNGKDEAYIKSYLSSRYSDYILYDPPIKTRSAILWFGPLLFLLLISYFLFKKNIKKKYY